MLKRTLTAMCLIATTLGWQAGAQITFDSLNLISDQADLPTAVYASDLNGDGDIDIVSSSSMDDKIAWYENLGGGVFSSQIIISSNAMGASDVICVDLDGDSIEDIVYASRFSNTLSWQRNLGFGTFGPEQIITSLLMGPISVFSIDMDGDLDNDLLSASLFDDRISYFENLGGGTFANGFTISVTARTATDVYAADLDGDGDNDVLSSSFDDDKIAWYENFDGDSFGLPNIITQATDGAFRVMTHDLDSDGDQDVISASANDNKIAWYQNNGNGIFSAPIIVTLSAFDVRNLSVALINGDGYPDIVSTSFNSDKVEWYANLNNGTFGPSNLISDQQDGPHALTVADVDNDGDQDIVTGSWNDNEIGWYESPRPNDCTAPDFLFVSNVGSESVTLNWSDTGDPHEYRIVGGKLGGPAISFIVSGFSFNVGGLLSDQGYWWRVESVCGIDLVPLLKIDTFFTQTPCTLPLALQTTAIGTDSAVLAWIPQDTSAIGYKIGIKELTAPLSSVIIINVNQPTTSFAMQNLTPCMVYQWIMNSQCGYEVSPLGPIKTFITLGCNANVNKDFKSATDEPDFSVSIYPNPATNVIYIDNEKLPSQLYLTDATGRVVLQELNMEEEGGKLKLNVEVLSTGMYFLVMTYPEGNKVEHFVISR